MLPICRDLRFDAASVIAYPAAYAPVGQLLDVRGSHRAVLAEAVAHKPLRAGELTEHRVVPVIYDRPVLRHEGEHFRLCAEHPLKVVQKLKVRVAYHREHRDRRLRYPRKRRHLAKARYAHLNDRGLMLPLDARYRHRYADLIIEVSLRLEHVHALFEHGRYHFLCRRLADAAGYPYHRYAELPPVPGAYLLKRRLNVVHQYYRPRYALRQIFRKAAGRTRLQRLCDEAVPVHVLAPVGDEHIPRLHLTAVDYRAAYRRIAVLRKAAAAYRRRA